MYNQFFSSTNVMEARSLNYRFLQYIYYTTSFLNLGCFFFFLFQSIWRPIYKRLRDTIMTIIKKICTIVFLKRKIIYDGFVSPKMGDPRFCSLDSIVILLRIGPEQCRMLIIKYFTSLFNRSFNKIHDVQFSDFFFCAVHKRNAS